VLNRQDNELLTRVGPETAMGAFFRRHWLPFLLANELVADAAPTRVRLLGESLVAFRDSQGRAGLLGEHCPHRRASLCLGRNAEGGLRCAYHGWKFDVSGACLEMPTEPAESGFRSKVRADSYPVLERGGLLWAYLGPPEKRAELPDFEWLGAPRAQRQAARWPLECNYAQALEGELDELRATPGPRDALVPLQTVHEAAYGLACGSRREVPGQYLWRISLFLWPCFTLSAPAEDASSRVFRAWVPADDTHTHVLGVVWRPDGPLGEAEAAGARPPGADLAVSAGPIADRSREHLGTSDKAVAAFRERMLSAARRLAQGIEPQSPYDPDCYRVRAHAARVPRDGRDFVEHEAFRRAMLAP
jgi:phthalate 4,5-dioxygenase oxygenase subunit